MADRRELRRSRIRASNDLRNARTAAARDQHRGVRAAWRWIFRAVNGSPPWFWRLATETFPFLGHILEEANEFWESEASGSREWGPCADTDESGREFHYKVIAVTVQGKAYLLFQLDP